MIVMEIIARRQTISFHFVACCFGAVMIHADTLTCFAYVNTESELGI